MSEKNFLMTAAYILVIFGKILSFSFLSDMSTVLSVKNALISYIMSFLSSYFWLWSSTKRTHL